MMKLLCSIRFRTQIRRTHGEEFAELEKAIEKSITACGGKITRDRRVVSADFNEESIGFALNILVLLESIGAALTKAAPVLHGHTCVAYTAGSDDDDADQILRSVPFSEGSGLWCGDEVAGLLAPFAEFSQARTRSKAENAPQFAQLMSLRDFSQTAWDYPLREKVFQIFEKDPKRSTALLGRDFIGKRACLHAWCAKTFDFPPLTVRFGSGGNGLGCFADAWGSAARERVLEALPDYPGELDSLRDMINAERLRTQNSRYITTKAEYFWRLLLETYLAAAGKSGAKGVVILENIQNAQETLRLIFFKGYDAVPAGTLVVYASCSRNNLPPVWKPLFPGVVSCASENIPVLENFSINRDLGEIAYACALLVRYFPASAFVSLFGEHGINPAMIQKAIDILVAKGVLRSAEDPAPEVAFFFEDVERLLGERKDVVKSLLKDFLLDAVKQGRLKACYRLLEAVYDLGGVIDDKLALEAIKSDVVNGTFASILRSISKERFALITDAPPPPPSISRGAGTRPDSLLYIFKTLKALTVGNETEIKNTMTDESVENAVWPSYRALIFTIRAIYRLGIHDQDAAMLAAKEALVISQDSGETDCLVQIYRLLSLVHFSKKQVNDAIDYLSFAIETAERTKNTTELPLAAYFAAGTHFAQGNVAKSLRLITQAEQLSVLSGRGEWASRAAFMRGRFLFEIGHYEEALEIFTSLAAEPAIITNEDVIHAKSATLAAWIYRCRIYTEGSAAYRSPPAQESDDLRLFKTEAAYLAGDYAGTVKLSERFAVSPPREAFLFIEQPDWSSGFSQCELLQVSRMDFYGRMASAWRAAALVALDKRNSGEASYTMQQILRDDRFSDTTPNDVLQYYLYYHILQESAVGDIDRNMAISLAFKRLQRRASRIDDPGIKRSFLTKQYWNRALFQAAQEHKLI